MSDGKMFRIGYALAIPEVLRQLKYQDRTNGNIHDHNIDRVWGGALTNTIYNDIGPTSSLPT
jgi:hypothetical protein